MIETLTSVTFPQDLFLDRRKGKYCFRRGPDQVRMAEAGKKVSLKELKTLFHPYGSVTILRAEEMFDGEVLRFLSGIESPALPGPAIASQHRGSPPPPEAQPKVPITRPPPATPSPPVIAPAPPIISRAPPVIAPVSIAPAKTSSEPEIPPAAASSEELPEPPLEPEIPIPPPPPPSAKLASLREDLRERVFYRIETKEGEAALLSGQMDGEIRSLVSAICQEVTPRQIIAAPVGGESKSDTDFYMDHAMTSQAFAAQLALGRTDLFLVAKSAILQTLTEADRKNIQIIKQTLLLGKPSPNFAKRLSQYYDEIAKYLRTNKTDPEIVDLIFHSKYIYFDVPVHKIPAPSLALGVADAFVTLREAGKFTLEILGNLPPRLKRLLPRQSGPALSSIEILLRDSCYNEFRKSLDARLSGGDHCDFFGISPRLYGLLIFDVSGHEEKASELRDILVKVIGRLADRSDPARTMTALNHFIVQYPFPEDTFVSMVYGVVDLGEGKFIFANAGHHPPYLIRRDSLNRLDQTGGLALNMGDLDYKNGSVLLAPSDCLVLYTDGLTEAVNRKSLGGPKELFGHRRLESVIAEKSIGALKAKRAVESILAAVRDQGFQIEDDITIQVYRHV